MHCRAAKRLVDLHEGDLMPAEAVALQEHLRHCSYCRQIEQYQRRTDELLGAHVPRQSAGSPCGTQHLEQGGIPTSPHIYASVSTESIMRAVKRQQRIANQLENLRIQQRTRIQRLRPIGAAIAAIGFFTLGSIPLLLLAFMIVLTDLAVQALTFLNNVIDLLIILAQYIQYGLIVVTRNNWLLSGVALAVVIMTGMWLRLMRPPQEVTG
jgi:hypothetical protein